mmetsp:Transcript_30563/g.91650  ORF Transcript_30563/g.91650 Transcript_30563/m.91650 type:complete len:234 (-) Transcript_30563:259-960(-)
MAFDGKGSVPFVVAASLRRHGFARVTVASEWMTNFKSARAEVDTLLKSAKLFACGKLANQSSQVASRSDEIVWLNDIQDTACMASLRALQRAVDRLVRRCEPWLGVSLIPGERQCAPIVIGNRSDAMVAIYHAYGPGYGANVNGPDGDGCGSDDGRLLTVLIHLNDALRGGRFVFHEKYGSIVDVPPAAGTLFLFRSDTVIHEVCPSLVRRRAMTAWYMGSGTVADSDTFARE